MKYKGFTLDSFQEESIKAIENNHSVVVSAPTGSGKTLIADYIINKHKDDDKQIIYTAPIKALSNQKFKDFSEEYGSDKVGIMTGDIVINPTAKFLIMTTEIYRNMVISEDKDVENVAYVIFDEIHYINDIERGYVWEESIIYSSENVRFLCLSATIPNSQEFSDWISAIKHHQVDTVVATKRNVPLKQYFYDQELGITDLNSVRDAKKIPHYSAVRGRGGKRKRIRAPKPNHVDLIKELGGDKLPCLFFNFSRHACELKAKELAKTTIFSVNKKIVEIVSKRINEAPSEISKLSSTKTLRETLPFGIGFHHAGLLPVLKEIVEELFSLGLLKVLYVTETFAVGINMPAKTVCFDSLRKYDGVNFRNLNTKEYFQIAGRAGRRGIDEVGYVVVMLYRPAFNYHEIREITDKDVEPIHSQFRLSVNAVLNLIYRHKNKEIEKILRLSFYSYQKYGDKYADIPSKVLMSRYNSIVRKLKKQQFILPVGEVANDGSKQRVDGINVNYELTEKGKFASRIFADEMIIGEIFATDFVEKLDEYQILLLIGALIYEHREMNTFKQIYRNEQFNDLKNKITNDINIKREKKFRNMDKVTSLIYPVYYGKTFFDVLKLTNLLEGDLIRFYAQILDRIGQIRKAGANDKLRAMLNNSEDIIKRVLEGIYLII